MILVTVGTHPAGFERLVIAADEMARRIDERVVIQYGSSKTIPKHAGGFDFVNGGEMESLHREASAVIAHAAAGSILTAFHAKKALVIVPRQKAFGEILDDHQFQLARALNASLRAVAVYQPSADSLMDALQKAKNIQPQDSNANRKLVTALSQRLALWAQEK